MKLWSVTAAALCATTSASWAQECNTRAFTVCSACHTLKEGEKKPGPQLNGVVGRKIAGDSAFGDYSESLKAARAKGETWTKEKLDVYLADPQAAYPGTTMGGAPIRNAKQRADILCVLGSR